MHVISLRQLFGVKLLRNIVASWCTSHQYLHSGPRATVSGENRLIDENVDIKIHGLPASQDVSLYASLKVSNNTWYESIAQYHTSETGNINLVKDPSLGGTYSGVEPMGLFWSMKPYTNGNKTHLRYPNTSIEAPTYNISVYKGKNSEMESFTITEKPRLNQLLQFSVQRPIVAPGVTRIPVRDHGLVGTLFLPEGEGPHPGVIVMFGGYPGIREYKGALLASRGFASLVLQYYGMEHLPSFLSTLDLSYFENAIEFMKQHPKVQSQNGLGLLGLCKGGSIAMAMATYLSNIRCVVWINGAISAVAGDLKYKDKFWPQLPMLPVKKDEDGYARLKNAFDVPPVDQFSELSGYYPFEHRHEVSYLLIACMDDQCVPSEYTAKVAEKHLQESHHPDYAVIYYPGAGHILEPPNFPLCLLTYQPEFGGILRFGGKQPLHSQAEKDAWERQLNFLSEKLNM